MTLEQTSEVLNPSSSGHEQAKRNFKEADQYKSSFLSTLSHEIRTPLNAILGFADLLKGQHYGSLNDKHLSYVEHIEESGKYLLALINDLLDIAKIDAGQMDALLLEPFSFATVIHSVTSMMSTHFSVKRLSLEVVVADDLKQPLLGDEKLCRQVLFNLLSNAVKFTPEGGKVTVQAITGEGFVRVSISDTGIGIPPDQQEKIFSESYQVDHEDGRQYEGTGIGLQLVRRLVKLMGGEFWLESEPSKGSTFYFTIALRRPAEVSAEGAEIVAPAVYETQ